MWEMLSTQGMRDGRRLSNIHIIPYHSNLQLNCKSEKFPAKTTSEEEQVKRPSINRIVEKKQGKRNLNH